MSGIKGFIYRNKRGFTFIGLLIFSFMLMFFSTNKPAVTFKKIGFSIIYPFQFTFNSLGNFFRDTFTSISQLKKLQIELKTTRNELNQYKKIVIDFSELNNQNIQLKKMLKLKRDVAYDSVTSEVVGMDPKRLFDVLIINKGSNDGIDVNMPVISYAGGKKTLIGKVVEITPFASKVMTLQNPRLSVGAVIVSNRVHTIIQGSSKEHGIVKLLYIPKDYELSETLSDYVYTSGDSFIFPRGIEIGKIVKLYPSKRYELFNEADVEISTDLSKIEYVLVLMVDYQEDDFKLEGLQN